MSLTLVQEPSTINLSHNYMWLEAKPDGAYSALTGYHVRYEVLNDDTNEILFTNVVKVYDSIWNANAVYDCHKAIQNYLSYDDTLPLTGTYGDYSTTNGLIKIQINAYEYTGNTLVSTTLNFSNFWVFYGGRSRNDIYNFAFTQYMPTNTTSKFLSDWIGNRTVRTNSIGSLKFFSQIPGYTAVYKDSLVVVYTDGTYDQYYHVLNSGMATTKDHLKYIGAGYYEVDSAGWLSAGTPAIYGVLSTPPYANSGKTADYYTLHLDDIGGNQISERVRFDIDRSCSTIDTYQLIWVNKLGGWDWYTFNREVHKSKDLVKTNYRKIDYGIASGTDMGTRTFWRGETILNLDSTDVYTVVSKILDNNMSKNLGGVFESTEVYLVEGGVVGEGLNIFPVIIDMDSVEIPNNYNRPDRAIYKFNFHKANKNVTLNG